MSSPGLRPAFGQVLRTPFLRAALLAMVLSGVSSSVMAPQLTLFLTRDLGAGLGVAGLYYLTNLTAPVIGWILGSISDRSGRRLRAYTIASLLTAVGWLVTASAQQLWVPFTSAALLLGFGGAAGGQLFAAVREHLLATQRSDASQITAVIRMGMTGGWIIGPMLGAILGEALTLRTVLVIAAALTVAQLLPFATTTSATLDVAPDHADPPSADSASSDQASSDQASSDQPSSDPKPVDSSTKTPEAGPIPLLLFTACCVLALTGNTMKYAYLPIFMEEDLHTPAGVFGAVIGTQQTIEFLMMPVCALAASRWGSFRVVAFGAAAGVAANLFFATADSVVNLFIGQALVGMMWAAIAALGIVVAQHLWASRLATASSVFMSASAVASALGGLIASLAVNRLGLPGVFWVPVWLCLAASVGLLVLQRCYRHVVTE